MNVLRLVVIGLMVCTVLALGVAMGRRADEPADRERADKLFTRGNYKDAYEGYRGLALDPKTEPDRSEPTWGERSSVSSSSGASMRSTRSARPSSRSITANWRLLQAAAESYLNDSQHFGFDRRGQVPSGSASRRRPIRRLVRARSCPRLAALGPGTGSRAV